jgi:putative DNA primase/helicase
MLDHSEVTPALEVNPSEIHQEPECPTGAEEQDVELKPLCQEAKTKEDKAVWQRGRPNLCPKDDRLIDRGKSIFGYEFVKLWDGVYSGYTGGDIQDEADLALSNYLKRLTEGDAGEIDRLFRLSGRMRDKWDKVHDSDGRTHGQAIIELAMSGTREPVDPEAVEIQKAISMILDTGGSPMGIKRKDLRDCPEMSTKFYWAGQRWQVDTDRQKTRQYDDDTWAGIRQAVVAAADKSGRGADGKYKMTSLIYATATRIHSEKQVAVIVPDDLDQDHMLFNCPNGTLDLRTGQLWPHRREDLSTKLSPVAYNPGADCPRWMRFMEEVMSGNQEKVTFLQKAAGYSLTGDTREQCLFDLWSHGGDGMTTFLNTLKAVMGQDYAVQAAGDAFTHKGTHMGIGLTRHDPAEMLGSRLVTLPVFEKGMRLNEALIKQVTGGNQISAWSTDRRSFTYRPSYKLWLLGNHKPEIQDQTHVMWRRIHVVEFGVWFDKDNTLGEQLLQELPGILNWMVQGCQAWLREGLVPPREVQEATASYRKEMRIPRASRRSAAY